MKIDWQEVLLDSLCTGTLASVATTAAVAACGRRDNGSGTAAVNAISHIAWGDEAAAHEEPSVKYTATGVALNTAAAISWAAIYHAIFARGQRRDPIVTLAGGPIVSALAYVTDYHVVPQRFTPGFELRLSNRSMWVVYSVLAGALAIGGLTNSNES